MILLAYTIFTITLVLQRKLVARGLALGLASLTIPAIPLGFFSFTLASTGIVAALFFATLALILFRGLLRPEVRAASTSPERPGRDGPTARPRPDAILAVRMSDLPFTPADPGLAAQLAPVSTSRTRSLGRSRRWVPWPIAMSCWSTRPTGDGVVDWPRSVRA